jgi:ATP-binding cassette, subfamily B, bacterial
MSLILDYVRKYKGLILLALLLATVNQVFSLLDPQIVRLLVDNYALKAGELSQSVFIKGVGLLLLAFVGVALVSRIAKNFQDYFVNVITQKVGTDMYADSVSHTFSLPYGIFEDQQSGALLQKLQKARLDTQKIIASFVSIIFLTMIGFIFVLGYAFYVHWSIGLSFVLVVPLMSVFIFVLSKKIKDAQGKIVRESAELAGATTETLRNVELVKSLGLEGQEIKRLNDVNEKILGLELKKVKLVRKLSFIQGTMINAVRTLLLLLMLWLLYVGSVTLGEFLTLFFYSFFLFAPLGELSTVVSDYQEAKASNEELSKVLELKPEKKPKNPVHIDKLERIDFKNVGFSYHSRGKSSVENVSLSVRGGETIAFVGPSGSGKTTLIKLLLGLYQPNKGKILISGVDSRKIDYNVLRNRIGLVSQETQLFAGTIRENLLFVNPKAKDKECLVAMRLASAMPIIERGGEGLNTKIGEGGIKLSGGEKQRLAIARALLRKPDVLVFDEATSSLDSLTEKEITKTIKDILRVRPNLISVLVAHRLSTINHADRIYVLDQGKIVEFGGHLELLEKNGLYGAMWKEQSREISQIV